ncbi:MAG: hypothetical protein HWD84_10065 [Flavobacteriaceae bacterium]|nr:hypothetical protein [Flavobacteriaceae bacterium]
MYRTAFLILLYGKEAQDSISIESLSKLDSELENCKLLIWNNGPDYLKNEPVKLKFNDVETVETVENLGLASIYNSFIDKVDAEQYVIFDDDTVVTAEYLRSLTTLSIDNAGVPIISHGNKRYEPVVNGRLFKGEPYTEVGENDTITSIGSGLVLGRNVINTVKSQYQHVFDERFMLYGVDDTFFRRINAIRLGQRFIILTALSHSLSRLEDENSQTKAFRIKERAYAHALICKFYKPRRLSLTLFLKNCFKYSVKRLFNIENDLHQKFFIIAYFKGKHYRAG